jgi:ribose transport system substrate-binding protein
MMKAGHRWLLAGALAAGIAAAPTVNAAQKHKIFLSMSYIGNDWQAEAANMARPWPLIRAWPTR